MAKVKLGEVAREYKATVKDAVDLPVVGLEHLIPGQVELTQWSEDTDNTFTKGFKKGQMLFGRRRAYLKKAALAPFNRDLLGGYHGDRGNPGKNHAGAAPLRDSK